MGGNENIVAGGEAVNQIHADSDCRAAWFGAPGLYFMPSIVFNVELSLIHIS